MIDCDWLRWTAILAMASAVLAQGDVPAAHKQTENARAQAAEANSERGLLCADLILAEIDRRKGRRAEATARLLPHDEYVRSESANWQIAMYTRAFPHMLGLLAAALSPEALPTRMLRMVLPEDHQKTLRASAEVLDESAWTRLAERVVGPEALADFPYAGGAPVCRVRLFGGLDVSVGDREVGERQWRKRKARALFAMLVLLQGREIARDQVLEHLWPEMDEDRGRNNFYVVWSAMKAALVPEADKVTPCPYVENAGGACRLVSSLVTSDVEQFECELRLAHEAESNGDTAEALRAYRQISLAYRGELLSGDLYNDWFAAPRDRYRQDFGDAMLRAGEIMAAGGDHVGALRMVREGIAADSWREDMLQAVLRYSRESGQRSAAIEIFSTVRTRLSEDLGIDPSAETLRLYEQVLAMEERAPYEADARDDEWGVPEL
jgi:DNA-binding SARP family transcriptional activator